ncbi:MAG: hypothetical protein KDD02_26065 [Phaeodactylibacter sp.]|nr:hypothetical protein [Phaeodactylibacter sp.]MCB9299041.1 hypothetical protein [Lewinellaceae bacterium]HQU58976.1 hypothetical protein [Saprospiraceae bacterium]
MIRLFSTILLLATIGQALYLPGLSFWLEWKKDYIANELCINRFEPELMCSGRCYVQEVTSRALEQEDDDKAPAPSGHKDGLSIHLTLPPALYLVSGGQDWRGAALPAQAQKFYAYLLPIDFFHPPRMAAPFSFV